MLSLVTVSVCFISSRRETFQVRVWRLWPKIRQQQRPEEALSRPYQRQALLLQSARLWQILHTPELVAETHESALQVPSAPCHQCHLYFLHKPSRRPSFAHFWTAQEPLLEPLPSGHQPQRVVRVPGERRAQPPSHPLQRRANYRFRRRGLFQKFRPEDNALIPGIHPWGLSNLSSSWPVKVCICVVPPPGSLEILISSDTDCPKKQQNYIQCGCNVASSNKKGFFLSPLTQMTPDLNLTCKSQLSNNQFKTEIWHWKKEQNLLPIWKNQKKFFFLWIRSD